MSCLHEWTFFTGSDSVYLVVKRSSSSSSVIHSHSDRTLNTALVMAVLCTVCALKSKDGQYKWGGDRHRPTPTTYKTMKGFRDDKQKKKKKKVVVSSLTVMHASFNNRPSPNRTTICIHAVLLVRPTDNHSLSFTSLSPSPSPSLLCSRYSISIGDDRACMAFPWLPLV